MHRVGGLGDQRLLDTRGPAEQLGCRDRGNRSTPEAEEQGGDQHNRKGGRDDAWAKPEAPVVEPAAEAPEHLEETIAGRRSSFGSGAMRRGRRFAALAELCSRRGLQRRVVVDDLQRRPWAAIPQGELEGT